MEVINVKMVDLPPTIRGLTVYYYGEDGQAYYTILINSLMSAEMNCRTYDHEMSHIDNHDFDKMIPIEDLEADRHLWSAYNYI